MAGLEWFALGIASLGTTTLAANLLYLGTYAVAIAGAAYLTLQKPAIPKAEDGTYNLKQNVPSLAFVLGWVKKGGDYAFLEQKGGIAFHIIVQACHEIEGYVQHYLHDEKATLNELGVVVIPTHFRSKYVKIQERLGLNAETAYADVIAAFPDIWTVDHRGDGLATVMMSTSTPSQNGYPTIYPNGMPELSSVIAGAKLFDPRTDTTAFSRNLSLMRLWHLTHPVGGKLTMDDMYLPEWENAADVSDVMRPNRDGVLEPTYHGGFWFRANNDPVDVGRIMDQAAEMVVYERPDGLVGVHAGEYVEPDITLTANDLVSVTLDANSRDAANVLAVRGRYTRLDLDYNVSDAAIYGDPYVDGDDTERTKTIENQAIQSHNHVQRLQKLAFIRANAPRVTVVAHYEAAEDVAYRRFVRVNYPPKLDNVVIEIVETPKLSLRNLTIEFTGIIVPPDLYEFDAATEEGEPGNDVIPVESGGVPTPVDFDVVIQLDGSSTSKFAYGVATWGFQDDTITYELEWQPTDLSEPPRTTMSQEDEDEVRSGILADGEEFRFRLRGWAGGSYSEWTSYITRSVIVDAVAPKSLTAFTEVAGTHYGQAPFSFTTKSDTHLRGIAIYRTAAGGSFDADTDLVTVIPALVGTTFTSTVGDAPTFFTTNGDFSSAGPPPSLGTNCSISGGKGLHSSGAAGAFSWSTGALPVGSVVRYGGTIDSISGASASFTWRLLGGTTVTGTAETTAGFKSGFLTSVTGNTTFAPIASTNAVLQIDNINAFIQTADQEPRGTWDYRAAGVNGSGIAGPVSGPVTVTVI